MPTQEERLTTLEKSVSVIRQETAAHIREVDENLTILLGVIKHQGRDIRGIFERLETVDRRLERIEDHLGEHTSLLAEHTKLLTQILERLPKTS